MFLPPFPRHPRRLLATATLAMVAVAILVHQAPAAPAPADGAGAARESTAASPLRDNQPQDFADALAFGDLRSEQEHRLTAEHSETLRGGLGEPARRLSPPGPAAQEAWQGGRLAFTMKVDPARPNYLTARFWGSEDGGGNRLILFCEGKQVGYRHLGDIDMLDDSNGEAPCPGRFFYNTLPLPEAMTRGKNELQLEIRSTGPIYGYAGTFDKYQRPMAAPSRGVYRLYTHTAPGFVPPATERQGAAPANPPVRQTPGPEVLDRVKERVNREVTARLDDRPISQLQLWFLARAYPVKWTTAHGNPQVVKKAVETLDTLYVAYKNDPKIAHSEPSVYNSDWFGVGPAASAVVILAEPLKPFLDAPVAGAPDAGVTRRAGWTEMFRVCRDWHRENRRQYTNQSMISDTFGLYWANRGIAVLTPAEALPEAAARRYLHESAGLEPWLGSERNGVPTKPLGENYFQLTAKGLTKELGFVGYYGEVLDWMTTMYEATRPAPDQPGDPALKAQLVKAARARAVFRYPGLDARGNRAMRAEAVIGWRDQGHYPADITYGQRPTWDSSAIEAAAATLDPALVGYARQMIADGQFFASLEREMTNKGLRVTAGLLPVPDDYEAIVAQPPAAAKLPMTAGQPDFVFTDEEDGVVAVKHGEEIFYASLYWRARYAINFLAKVHHIAPGFERVGVVRQGTEFTPGGQFYTRKDWVNMGFGNGGMRYPGDLHSAHVGEQLPIPKVPDGVGFKPGDESPYAGKGDFYTLRYGRYLIGMNCTADREFPLPMPAGVASARDLATGKTVTPDGQPLKVGPKSTLVLFLGEPNAPIQASAGVSLPGR